MNSTLLNDEIYRLKGLLDLSENNVKVLETDLNEFKGVSLFIEQIFSFSFQHYSKCDSLKCKLCMIMLKASGDNRLGIASHSYLTSLNITIDEDLTRTDLLFIQAVLESRIYDNETANLGSSSSKLVSNKIDALLSKTD